MLVLSKLLVLKRKKVGVNSNASLLFLVESKMLLHFSSLLLELTRMEKLSRLLTRVSAERLQVKVALCGTQSWLIPIPLLEVKITAKFNSNYINILRMVITKKLVFVQPLMLNLEIHKLQVILRLWAKMGNILWMFMESKSRKKSLSLITFSVVVK